MPEQPDDAPALGEPVGADGPVDHGTGLREPSDPTERADAPEPTEPTEATDAEATEAEPQGRRIRRWHIAFGVVVVLLVAAIVASFINIPYYAITPGSAQAVAPLINVKPQALVQNHGGSVSLVDVELTQIRAIEWIYFELDPAATIVQSSSLLGPETAAQYNTEGVLDMSNAQQAATVVGLRTLGFHVTAAPSGALLYALLPGSPAESAFVVGDVITSVDGRIVLSAEGLSRQLEGRKPGETVTVGFRAYPNNEHRTTPVRLGAWHWHGSRSSGQLDCLPVGAHTNEAVADLIDHDGVLSVPGPHQTGAPVACLGVLQTETAYTTGPMPVKVDLSSEGIVGPSAGLAFTLGLIEKLDKADLTGGHKVAATGTMSINGQVGAIGGIQQKTIAVRNAGDSIFLVPPANFAVAKKYAGSQLKVYAVSNIDQAISVLEAHGGKIVPPVAPSS